MSKVSYGQEKHISISKKHYQRYLTLFGLCSIINLREFGIFVKKYNLTVETDIVTDPLSALKKIDNSYSGAILDLKSDTDHEGGNKIVRRLHDLSISVPVIFVTRHLDRVKEDPLIIRKRSRNADTYESDLLFLQGWLKTESNPAEIAQTYTALIRWNRSLRHSVCEIHHSDAHGDLLRFSVCLFACVDTPSDFFYFTDFGKPCEFVIYRHLVPVNRCNDVCCLFLII